MAVQHGIEPMAICHPTWPRGSSHATGIWFATSRLVGQRWRVARSDAAAIKNEKRGNLGRSAHWADLCEGATQDGDQCVLQRRLGPLGQLERIHKPRLGENSIRRL